MLVSIGLYHNDPLVVDCYEGEEAIVNLRALHEGEHNLLVACHKVNPDDWYYNKYWGSDLEKKGIYYIGTTYPASNEEDATALEKTVLEYVEVLLPTLTWEQLDTFAKVSYQVGVNPLPALRKHFAPIPVLYGPGRNSNADGKTFAIIWDLEYTCFRVWLGDWYIS